VSALSAGHAPPVRRHEVVTPEGVPLSFVIAPAGDRAGAFLLDATIIGLSTVAVFLLLLLARVGLGWTAAVANLLLFAIQNAYFVWFEARWQGSTPGKRAVGIRVIDARGGTLTVEAVLARNLVRVLEVLLPLAVLLAPESLWPGAPGWARLASAAWVLVFCLFPLFNRDRLRIGDLVAGTCVVEAPKAVLLEDVGAARRSEAVATAPAHAFTERQLDVYGVYELQVLEDVLRRPRGEGDRETARVVAEKIAKKIRWQAPVSDPLPFLRDFYAALRDRLERRMLLGKRKADKHSR
jgi:uncharacterized RDD family membrane protein YckC